MIGHGPGDGTHPLASLRRAALHALSGLACAARNERSFRQELAAAALLVPAALLLPANGTQTAMLIASVLLVLIVELLNSAIETAVDRISLDDHELSGRAKDLGSAAVFVSLWTCAAVWTGVLCDLFT